MQPQAGKTTCHHSHNSCMFQARICLVSTFINKSAGHDDALLINRSINVIIDYFSNGLIVFNLFIVAALSSRTCISVGHPHTPPEVAQPDWSSPRSQSLYGNHLSWCPIHKHEQAKNLCLFLPSVESPKEPDNRSTVAVHRSFHTRTGNRNPYDITQMLIEETSA